MSMLIINIFGLIVTGVSLGLIEQRRLIASVMVSALVGFSILILYYMHEGLPAFPPISSKDKLAYLFSLLPFLVFIIFKQGLFGRLALTVLLGAGCFLWLVQRLLLAGRFEWSWLLPILTIVIFLIGAYYNPPQKRSLFAWPVTLLSISIVASFIALFGGFLGLGQILVSFSAFLGGYVLALYIISFNNNSSAYVEPSSQWVLQCGLMLFLIQLSTFATNLSVAGYLALLVLMGLPFADDKISRLPVFLQPFGFAAIGLLAGVPAILMAFLNF